MPTWGNRFPFLSSRDKLKMLQRLAACAPAIERQLKLPSGSIEAAEELGCGNYGCVFRPKGLAAGRVLKLTADNLEASTVNYLIETYSGGDSKLWHDEVPVAIVRYYRIWQLGTCNVLPKQRGFRFTSRELVTRGYDYRPRKTIYYRGPGAPYRPYWLIEREELPDVMTGLKPLGVKRRELEYAVLEIYAAYNDGYRILRDPIVPTGNRLATIQRAHCGELHDAVAWLYDNSIKFSDYRKIANLGWRGDDVVIRDLGATDTGFLRGYVPEDVERLGLL